MLLNKYVMFSMLVSYKSNCYKDIHVRQVKRGVPDHRLIFENHTAKERVKVDVKNKKKFCKKNN